MTPPWTLTAWPATLWQPSKDTSPHFVHLGTTIATRINSEWPNMGQAVWGGRFNDMAVGISWDWIEVTHDVVALADPMTIVSNLRLIGVEGEVMTAHETAPHLNALVRGLEWQAEVLAAIKRESGPDAVGDQGAQSTAAERASKALAAVTSRGGECSPS